jgi:murein DD-endopeptidase MepM/ murein hydrolase activator NlpD
MLRTVYLFFLVHCLVPSTVLGFSVTVVPEEITQGDAFMIEVTSQSDIKPDGTIGKKQLSFHRVSPGKFIALSSTGMEQPSKTYVIDIKQGEESQSTQIQVGKRKSRKINLTLPKDKVVLSPKNEKRANYESALLRRNWSRRSEKMWQGNFFPPLDTEVSTEFGIIRIINGHKRSRHKGVDFKGKSGIPVKAINGGTVSVTDDQFFGGKTVMIDHGEGIFSVYMHLKMINVEEGQHVNRSDTIGLVGSTGRSTGPHLHLTVKWDGYTVDPLSLFNLPIE